MGIPTATKKGHTKFYTHGGVPLRMTSHTLYIIIFDRHILSIKNEAISYYNYKFCIQDMADFSNLPYLANVPSCFAALAR